jgi:hypothetical protein
MENKIFLRAYFSIHTYFLSIYAYVHAYFKVFQSMKSQVLVMINIIAENLINLNSESNSNDEFNELILIHSLTKPVVFNFF